MSTINGSITRYGGADSIVLMTYAGMATGAEGAPLAFPDWADRSVQVSGTFGGATLSIQGSNDGENWAALHDPSGTALNYTAGAIKQVMESPLYMKPVVVGGDETTDLKVVVCARKGTPRAWGN